MSSEIRWLQRFENLTKSYALFKRVLAVENPSEVEDMGLIQSFEIVFELSWKTMKDYLDAQGHEAKSPREVLKQAYQNEYITLGHLWMEMLENRNLLTHTYNDVIARKILTLIRVDYARAVEEMYDFFVSKTS